MCLFTLVTCIARKYRYHACYTHINYIEEIFSIQNKLREKRISSTFDGFMAIIVNSLKLQGLFACLERVHGKRVAVD